MSAVNVTAVNVLDNPAPFTNPLQFEVHYECLTELQEDLEWKIVYVGSAESEKFDQILDCVMVGPVAAGKFKFVFQAPAPDPSLIPKDDIVGVTVILLTCSYKGSEFLRVGYYVNNEYEDEQLREEPPSEPIISKLRRSILEKTPRVTRFANNFDDPPPEINAQEDEAMDDMEGCLAEEADADDDEDEEEDDEDDEEDDLCAEDDDGNGNGDEDDGHIGNMKDDDHEMETC